MSADPHEPANVAEIPAALDLEVFRQMVDMSNEAFYLTDSRGRFRYVNDRALTLTGYTREELLGMTFFDLDPEFPSEQFEAVVAALAHGPLPPFEARTRRKDGIYHPTEASVARIEIEGKTYLFGVVRDLTERKQIEAAQKSFAQRMLQTLEAERQRVARELHDDVGQAIATVGVLLHTLERTPGAVPEEARPALEATHTTIQQITESVARIVRDYHPADLLGLGFEDTVRAHARQFAHRHHLALRLATVPVAGLLPPDHELHLYRIVQEALANVAHHARARRVTLRLVRQRQRLVVTVRDNGVGFAPERARSTGLGLVTMRERAELMKGELVVRSVPGRGTEIRVTVPLGGARDAPPTSARTVGHARGGAPDSAARRRESGSGVAARKHRRGLSAS
jgi:PAS domain S-box-containing protein